MACSSVLLAGMLFLFSLVLFPNLYYVIILILFLVLNTDVISIFSLSLSRNNRYGNCCSDYNAVCKGSGPPVPPPPSPPPSPPGRLPATCQEVVYGNPAVRKLKNSKYAVSPVPLGLGLGYARLPVVRCIYIYKHILLYLYIYIYGSTRTTQCWASAFSVHHSCPSQISND